MYAFLIWAVFSNTVLEVDCKIKLTKSGVWSECGEAELTVSESKEHVEEQSEAEDRCATIAIERKFDRFKNFFYIVFC